MKKAQLNKILIISLIVIWGVLIYKYASPYFKTHEFTAPVRVDTPADLYVLFKKDTFALELSKRDPFLDTRVFKKKTPVFKPIAKKVIKKKSLEKPNVWPSIQYLGFVKSNASKSRLGLMRINNKLYKVRDGEKLKMLGVIKVEEDSIQLLFEGKKKYFKR